MSENVQPATGSGTGTNAEQPGMVHYEKQRQYLKELIQNRKSLERQLLAQEQTILQKETEYLESTPFGNIIVGFDNYIKGSTSAAAQRKRTGLIDQNRVFSRSSISHNPAHPEHAEAASATSTPAAPTPLSTSFPKDKDKDGGSNQPTPTSATTDKKAPSKKKKQKKEADAEDSETDSRENKKVRTHFGGSRK